MLIRTDLETRDLISGGVVSSENYAYNDIAALYRGQGDLDKSFGPIVAEYKS